MEKAEHFSRAQKTRFAAQTTNKQGQKQMNLETRLASFQPKVFNHDVVYFSHNYYPPQYLASIGLFWDPSIRQPRRVQCCHCHTLLNLQNSKRVNDLHVKLSPTCPLAQINKAREIVKAGDKDWHDLPQFDPVEQNFETRLKTFPSKWSDDRPSREDLAKGGLFWDPLANNSGVDRCTCMYCGIHLQDWEIGDDVTIEHGRTSPDCWVFNSLKNKNSPVNKPVLDKSFESSDAMQKRLSVNENYEIPDFDLAPMPATDDDNHNTNINNDDTDNEIESTPPKQLPPLNLDLPNSNLKGGVGTDGDPIELASPESEPLGFEIVEGNENITVDYEDEKNYFNLVGDGSKKDKSLDRVDVPFIPKLKSTDLSEFFTEMDVTGEPGSYFGQREKFKRIPKEHIDKERALSVDDNDKENNNKENNNSLNVGNGGGGGETHTQKYTAGMYMFDDRFDMGLDDQIEPFEDLQEPQNKSFSAKSPTMAETEKDNIKDVQNVQKAGSFVDSLTNETRPDNATEALDVIPSNMKDNITAPVERMSFSEINNPVNDEIKENLKIDPVVSKSSISTSDIDRVKQLEHELEILRGQVLLLTKAHLTHESASIEKDDEIIQDAEDETKKLQTHTGRDTQDTVIQEIEDTYGDVTMQEPAIISANKKSQQGESADVSVDKNDVVNADLYRSSPPRDIKKSIKTVKEKRNKKEKKRTKTGKLENISSGKDQIVLDNAKDTISLTQTTTSKTKSDNSKRKRKLKRYLSTNRDISDDLLHVADNAGQLGNSEKEKRITKEEKRLKRKSKKLKKSSNVPKIVISPKAENEVMNDILKDAVTPSQNVNLIRGGSSIIPNRSEQLSPSLPKTLTGDKEQEPLDKIMMLTPDIVSNTLDQFSAIEQQSRHNVSPISAHEHNTQRTFGSSIFSKSESQVIANDELMNDLLSLGNHSTPNDLTIKNVDFSIKDSVKKNLLLNSNATIVDDTVNLGKTTSIPAQQGWQSLSTVKYESAYKDLKAATGYIKEIVDSEYNLLSEDMAGLLTDFIAEIPEEQLKLTIREWVKAQENQAVQLVRQRSSELKQMFLQDCERVRETLLALPEE